MVAAVPCVLAIFDEALSHFHVVVEINLAVGGDILRALEACLQEFSFWLPVLAKGDAVGAVNFLAPGDFGPDCRWRWCPDYVVRNFALAIPWQEEVTSPAVLTNIILLREDLSFLWERQHRNRRVPQPVTHLGRWDRLFEKRDEAHTFRASDSCVQRKLQLLASVPVLISPRGVAFRRGVVPVDVDRAN